MILIEFEGGSARKIRMEFHPLLTVVDGFNEKQRSDLSSRIQASLTGEDTGLVFGVDIGGTRYWLTPDIAQSLGLRNASLDNIIRMPDLPGVTVGSAGVSSEDSRGLIATARADLEKAQKRLEDAEIALERARTPRSPVESSVIEQLTATHERARSKVGELRIRVDALPVHDSNEERDKRIYRLETIAQAIRDRTKELRVLLERPQRSRRAADENTQPSAAELAEAWIENSTRLEKEMTQPPRAPRWLVESARADLIGARERVEELKATGDTFSMSKALKALADAKAVWSEIEGVEVGAIEALKEERAWIYSHALALIGREVDTVDIVQRLRSLPEETPPQPEMNPEREKLQGDLAAAILDHQDVLHEIRELRSVEIIDPTPEELATRKRLTEELERAETAEAELGERLAELQVAARRVPLPNPSMIAIVTEERDAAFTAMASANRRLEHLTHGAPRDVVAEVAIDPYSVPVAQLDVSGIKQDAAEVFVLSRIARLRQFANGESVPLIIDAAFDRLPGALQLRLLNLLGSVASTVQVIYLASSESAVEWAYRQNERLAAVVRLERK